MHLPPIRLFARLEKFRYRFLFRAICDIRNEILNADFSVQANFAGG